MNESIKPLNIQTSYYKVLVNKPLLNTNVSMFSTFQKVCAEAFEVIVKLP